MALQTSIFSSRWFLAFKNLYRFVWNRFMGFLPKKWREAASQFLRQSRLQAHTLVLDPREMFHLSIRLPLAQKKVIEEVIAFQIESKIPFPVEEAVYSILDQQDSADEVAVSVAVISLGKLKEKALELKSQASGKNVIAISPAKALHSFHFGVEVDRLGHWQARKGTGNQEESIYLLPDERQLSLWIVHMGPKGVLRNHLVRMNSSLPDSNQESLSSLAREIKRTLLSWSIPLDKRLLSYGFDVASCDCFAVHGLTVLSLKSSRDEHPFQYGAASLTSINPFKEDFFTLGKITLSPKEKKVFSSFLAKLAISSGILLLLTSSTKLLNELVLTRQAYHQAESRLSPLLKGSGGKGAGRSLSQWREWIVKKTAPYDVEPKLPNIGEILSWVGKSIRKVGEKEKVDTLSIVLEELQYEMESFPTLEKKSKPYRLKLDLHMSASDPSLIEHVRRELVSSSWVDKTKKVLWSPVGHNGYRMTLYLKPLRK